MSGPKVRSLAYHLLSRLFLSPEKDEGLPLARHRGISCLNKVSFSGDLDGHLSDLRETLSRFDLETLQVEYVRLFDYRPICPPYESAYRPDKLKHHIAEDLAKLYKHSGLQCHEGVAHDHITVEMEFMHYLCAQESCDKENVSWRNHQVLFLEEHLLKWLPAFCSSLQENAATPYRLLGYILSAVMIGEQKRLSIPKADTEADTPHGSQDRLTDAEIEPS